MCALRRITCLTLFISLTLSIGLCHASDDDFEENHEDSVEDQLDERDDDDEWEESDFDEAEDELEDRLEARFGHSDDIDDDLEDRLEDMFGEREDQDNDFEDELEEAFEDRFEDNMERLEQRLPDRLDSVHQLAELDERLDDLEVLSVPDEYIELIDAEELEALRSAGVDIQSVEKLGGLGQLLVTFGDEGRPPSAELNHLYTLDGPAEKAGKTAIDDTQSSDGGLLPLEAASYMGIDRPSPVALRIGMMDSSIDQSHECFTGTPIEQRVFIPSGSRADYRHGTAMATVFSRSCGILQQSEVYNAVVFGRGSRGAVVASAADLIRGLDWLLGVQPDVINLSLSGPPNRMLSAAIEQMLLRGIRIVASVGNDGAAAFPRYPAAQPGVIAVTAVDTAMAVYTRAVRGHHVQFSAPGVGLRLAAPDQRFAIEDGTSVASALASAVLAQGHSVRQYEDSAIDLGEPGFDDTFGFGLLNIDKIMTSSGE